MKNQTRYRIKDLRNSTDTRESFITNASNNTIYKGKVHVGNKIQNLTKTPYARYKTSELEVQVLEMVVTETISAELFYASTVLKEVQLKKAKELKEKELSLIKKQFHTQMGIDLTKAYELKNRGLLSEEAESLLVVYGNKYQEISSKPLEEFVK